jgi:hypothetical protein
MEGAAFSMMKLSWEKIGSPNCVPKFLVHLINDTKGFRHLDNAKVRPILLVSCSLNPKGTRR